MLNTLSLSLSLSFLFLIFYTSLPYISCFTELYLSLFHSLSLSLSFTRLLSLSFARLLSLSLSLHTHTKFRFSLSYLPRSFLRLFFPAEKRSLIRGAQVKEKTGLSLSYPPSIRPLESHLPFVTRSVNFFLSSQPETLDGYGSKGITGREIENRISRQHHLLWM